MRLSAPTQAIFIVALVLAVLALVGHFVPTTPYAAAYKFWLAIAAYAVLMGGCLFKGM